MDTCTSGYLRVVGPENECAKHGKEHMRRLEINQRTHTCDGHITIYPNNTIWVCEECAGPEYLSILKKAYNPC